MALSALDVAVWDAVALGFDLTDALEARHYHPTSYGPGYAEAPASQNGNELQGIFGSLRLARSEMPPAT
jgi:hypothetical protein